MTRTHRTLRSTRGPVYSSESIQSVYNDKSTWSSQLVVAAAMATRFGTLAHRYERVFFSCSTPPAARWAGGASSPAADPRAAPPPIGHLSETAGTGDRMHSFRCAATSVLSFPAAPLITNQSGHRPRGSFGRLWVDECFPLSSLPTTSRQGCIDTERVAPATRRLPASICCCYSTCCPMEMERLYSVAAVREVVDVEAMRGASGTRPSRWTPRGSLIV